MTEFRSRWLTNTPDRPCDCTDKTDESPAVPLLSVLSVTLQGGTAAISVSPAEPYAVRVSVLLQRWAALGRPTLLMPRRPLPGQTVRPAPYAVPDLGTWFLESRPPAGNDWAERYPEELETLVGLLDRLESERNEA